MNLFNISKEIKKINNTLDYLKNQNHNIMENIDKHSIINLTDQVQNNINELYNKIDHLYNFNINCKFNYENKNYNEIQDFLMSINIDKKFINKIIFLNFNSLNEILLEDDEKFEKLDIPINEINYIKNKIQEKIYTTSIEF